MASISVRFFLIVLSALLVSGCSKEAMTKKGDETIPVKVMRVRLEDISRRLEYIGDIKGRDQVVVYPKVSGKVIEKVLDENYPVKKGEAIAYIDRDEVGLKFEKAPVESPLTGTVGRVYVDIGSSVTPQTPVALVADMEMAEIGLNIPEKFLPQISLNQSAEISVDAYPDEKIEARVTMISPVVDLQTRTASLEITVDNKEGRLKPGMFAKVNLILEKGKKTPVILKESIMGSGSDTYVFVIEDKKALLKKVKLGIRQGPYYEVVEGLKESDAVVIMGQQRLRDGSRVEAEE